MADSLSGRPPEDRTAEVSGKGLIDPQVFTCLPLGLIVFDLDLRIIYHNPAAGMLANESENLVTALKARTLDSSYEDWSTVLHQALEHRREQRFEQVLYRDDAGERLFDLVCVPLLDPTGVQVTGGVLMVEDVTARVGMEKRLAVSERMAAVGKLAARVAHELNNPLDGILRYINLAIRAVETGQTDRLRDYLLHGRGGLLRMTEIIRELVEFSRSPHTAFDDTGLNACIEEAVKVMSDRAVGNGVSIICRLQDGVPATRGANLFQVFCNLIKNAIDAMPDGGTLTIITQIIGQEVVIRFEDTGMGLPVEMERIFEPFFTTKPPGKGTGLGLAICKDIIDKYNGRITPSRRSEGGTVFTLQIPMESCVQYRRPAPAGTDQSADSSPQEHVHE